MASFPVMQAFEARLQEWSGIASCPFVDANAVSPVAKPPFIEIEYPVASENRAGPGKRQVFRERGGARFVITVAAFAPDWKQEVFGWVEELRDLFRDHAFSAEIKSHEVSPATLDDRNKNGNRYRVSFAALYTRDTIKG